ncbi:MAG: protein-L-isoaspartate O-methyltransferase [Emcibacter sp.]|nr:protein-L-isoaspartate O-methyltransferase [Emcibacter sp.]
MSDTALARQHMIDNQLRPNEVNNEKIINAIKSVNREKFVPKRMSGVAYIDDNIVIAKDRIIMGSMVFSRLVEAAAVKKTDLVLDIACGTGYSSAILGRLAGAVVALEENAELVQVATEILSEESCDNVAVVTGSLVEGLPGQGPYNVIFINGMIDYIPDVILKQLAEDGRLVCIINDNGVGKATYVTRNDGVIGKRILFDASIPSLAAFKKIKKFNF